MQYVNPAFLGLPCALHWYACHWQSCNSTSSDSTVFYALAYVTAQAYIQSALVDGCSNMLLVFEMTAHVEDFVLKKRHGGGL